MNFLNLSVESKFVEQSGVVWASTPYELMFLAVSTLVVLSLCFPGI